MTDKDILYTVLSREVDNILSNFAPTLRMFSDNITMKIIRYIDPYVDKFLTPAQSIDTDMAKAFIDKEVKDRMESFIAEFHKTKISANHRAESDSIL